ncbi:2-keto-4-pentenoate hydratase [Fructilactobacillus sanfranciscensis]|uniref:2-keto-4-pentenoate hydratase n=2 Tax=Fructilactobacillus sanfranciscensis TaxID=1625 RepID=UPI0006EFF821|nr:2-oxo-hepta-3-ene-1, 7-dioate hydratase [Fructilactobacillus sanfranciscensis DSM 20451]
MMTEKKLTRDEVDKLAKTLYKAYAKQKPLDMHEFPEFDDDSAYAIQRELTDLKAKKLGGYKISLTSEETQKMFAATEPLYGAQLDERFFKSGVKLKQSMFMEPLVEVELVFTAKKELAATDSLEELMVKTTVAPAVELPDCRFKDWFPALPKHLVMADAAVGGAVVYGDEVPAEDFTLSELTKMHTELFRDRTKVAEGKSSEVLGNPIKALKWLTEKLAETNQVVHAGEHVSTGTFLLPVPLTPGNWEAEFDYGLSDVKFEVEK